ncbi:MAG TPA: nuclear transport factor 2 family protein, partial [Gemmatimonadaceae bacterium]|nr:nuclear transport factor 2 family protein [Gemmatimonadaceae bacterium]
IAFILALAAPATLASQNTSSPPPPARVTLLLAERELASNVYRDGYAKGILEALDERGAFLYEAAPVIVGREHARALLDAQKPLATLRIVSQPITAVVSTDGNFGIAYGTSLVSDAALPRDSLPRPASYINVWRRPPNGAWKLIARVDAGLVDPSTVVLPDAIRSLPPVRGALMNRPLLDYAQADAAFSRVAGESGAPAAFGQYAAPDGATFGGSGAINLGPLAIRSSLQTSRSAQSAWSWRPVYGAASAGGDLAYTVGEATIRPPNAAAADVYYGKYLTVWRRQADGSLKYLVDAGNSIPAPAP